METRAVWEAKIGPRYEWTAEFQREYIWACQMNLERPMPKRIEVFDVSEMESAKREHEEQRSLELEREAEMRNYIPRQEVRL